MLFSIVLGKHSLLGTYICIDKFKKYVHLNHFPTVCSDIKCFNMYVSYTLDIETDKERTAEEEVDRKSS